VWRIFSCSYARGVQIFLVVTNSSKKLTLIVLGSKLLSLCNGTIAKLQRRQKTYVFIFAIYGNRNVATDIHKNVVDVKSCWTVFCPSFKPLRNKSLEKRNIMTCPLWIVTIPINQFFLISWQMTNVCKLVLQIVVYPLCLRCPCCLHLPLKKGNVHDFKLADNYALLRHYVASSWNFLLMFRYRLPVLSSGGQESKRFVFVDSLPPKMGPIGCTETSVRNYHYSLRNIPEERSSQEAMCSPKLWYSQLLWHCAVTKDYTMSMVTLFAQILCTHQRCTNL